MTERIGGRKTGLIGLGLSLITLVLGWQVANSFGQFLALAVLVGIAGAGNSGTLVSKLLAPRLAMRFGWHVVFGFALIPVVIVWLLFALLAKDAPVRINRPGGRRGRAGRLPAARAPERCASRRCFIRGRCGGDNGVRSRQSGPD